MIEAGEGFLLLYSSLTYRFDRGECRGEYDSVVIVELSKLLEITCSRRCIWREQSSSMEVRMSASRHCGSRVLLSAKLDRCLRYIALLINFRDVSSSDLLVGVVNTLTALS